MLPFVSLYHYYRSHLKGLTASCLTANCVTCVACLLRSFSFVTCRTSASDFFLQSLNSVKFLIGIFFCIPSVVFSYPLDGFHETNITRLEGYFYSLRTPSAKENFVFGSLQGLSEIELFLSQHPFPLPIPDKQLSQDIIQLLGKNSHQYGVALLDYSHPEKPLYAANHDRQAFLPGSVGKILIAAGIFQALADLSPHDIQARKDILRERIISADHFIESDTHEVPFWTKEEGKIFFRPLQIGDRANLWTYLDWMLSASSNAAASMVLKELMLMKHFQQAYPPPLEVAEAFFEKSSKQMLVRLLHQSLDSAIQKNGLDLRYLRQGSFYTKAGKKVVPSSGSTATPKDLIRLLLLIEQGRFIDPFSSLELKRLLYVTQKRIRYIASPVLDRSAVYSKSGSLYSCKPEKGFFCQKYEGNMTNILNSVAVIESPARNPTLRYMIVLSSHVLRKNSAEDHERLATEIHELMERRNFIPEETL